MAYDSTTPPLQNPQSRPPRRGGGGGGAWVWIVVLVIAGIIIWIAFSWSGGHYRANTVNRTNGPYDHGSATNSGTEPATTTNTGTNTGSNQGNFATINSASQLTQGNASNLVGQPVQLTNATVAQVSGKEAFLIDANGKQVLVVPARALAGGHATQGSAGKAGGAKGNTATPAVWPAVKTGESVSIQGTIEKAPSKGQLESQYHLSGSEAAQAKQPGIYISALSVTPSK